MTLDEAINSTYTSVEYIFSEAIDKMQTKETRDFVLSEFIIRSYILLKVGKSKKNRFG